MLDPAYIAGFFDGEGNASLIYSKVRKQKRDPDKYIYAFKFTLAIANTFLPVLESLKEQFGGDISDNRTTRKPHHKKVFSWKLAGADGQLVFLKTISPFVIVKARQVELSLLYLDTAVAPGQRIPTEAWTRRIEIFQELRRVNMRGIEKPPLNHIPDRPSLGWNPKHREYGDGELARMMEDVRARRKISRYAITQ